MFDFFYKRNRAFIIKWVCKQFTTLISMPTSPFPRFPDSPHPLTPSRKTPLPRFPDSPYRPTPSYKTPFPRFSVSPILPLVKLRLPVSPFLFTVLFTLIFTATHAATPEHVRQQFAENIEKLTAFGDRSTGTSGNTSAGEYIKDQFKKFGVKDVGSQLFTVPVLKH